MIQTTLCACIYLRLARQFRGIALILKGNKNGYRNLKCIKRGVENMDLLVLYVAFAEYSFTALSDGFRLYSLYFMWLMSNKKIFL